MRTKMKVIIKVLPIIAYSIIMSLLIYSCEKNEEIENSTVTKSATYTEKADLTELINKIGDKDLELITLIQNNPISKLKTNSGTSDYYFDTEHIMALKNDKNEASYNIPVYIKSDVRPNFLYSISIEILAENIDTKLNILEIKNDGTEKYSAIPFKTNNPHSLTSKLYSVECYCVTTVSDCTCCATHADGGCTHPNVSVSCGCSGSGSPEMGTSGGSGNTTYWSGGSGTGYAYASTGTGIYVELMKKFTPDYSFSLLEKHTIINNVAFSQSLLDFLNTEGYTPVNKAFVISMIYAIEDGQIVTNQQFSMALSNFKYSQKSPMDIDLTNILTNLNLPESQKFKYVYDALTKSPEFQKLFVNIFNDSKRNNVKFEIAEHVYEDNDPTKKEVNATTSQDPVTKKITIKINKQILITGTGRSQTNIENAKTILHECIHAYLFVKANNPAMGVDFVKILNTMYPTPNEQHDFMYGKMIPTMQKVLGEIRDFVTTAPKRAVLETQITMHPTTNPLTSTPWIWTDYYKYITINGLEETNCFKVDFPINSDKFNLFSKYIEYGHNELDKQ